MIVMSITFIIVIITFLSPLFPLLQFPLLFSVFLYAFPDPLPQWIIFFSPYNAATYYNYCGIYYRKLLTGCYDIHKSVTPKVSVTRSTVLLSWTGVWHIFATVDTVNFLDIFGTSYHMLQFLCRNISVLRIVKSS